MMPRILIAGIGNIFLGDDGFGVEVARRLQERELPPGAEVVDYGIRGMDLAYALVDTYDAVIFVDAAQRGEPPGTLSVIEHDPSQERTTQPDAHSMDPLKVLSLARVLGARPIPTLVVACEPELMVSDESGENILVQLSDPVRASIDPAIELVLSVAKELSQAQREFVAELHL